MCYACLRAQQWPLCGAGWSLQGWICFSKFACTLESHKQLLLLFRGTIKSPKTCVVSEILHLKHKAQLPHIFIFSFGQNYWVPLQPYSVQVKSSNNFLDGSIFPRIILKIISDSLKSLLVLFIQWESENFYFHVFSLFHDQLHVSISCSHEPFKLAFWTLSDLSPFWQFACFIPRLSFCVYCTGWWHKLCPTSQKGTVYLQQQFIPLE